MKLNPLSICDKRKMDFLPIHFSKFQITSGNFFHDENLIDWIESKLFGRYSVTTLPSVDTDGKLTSSVFVGFEDPKELTYFMLAYPNLRRK